MKTTADKTFTFASYGGILRVREAYAFELGALLVRLCTFMNNIGIVTMLTLLGTSAFRATSVPSLIAVVLFVVQPRISKKMDEFGQRRIIPLAAVVTIVGYALLLCTVRFGLPFWLCYPAAVFIGFTPSAPAIARTRWTYLIRSGKLGSDAPDIKTVYSYEGVIDDIAFMISPALSVALSSGIVPTAGMFCGALFFAAGVGLLLAARSTEPPVGWVAQPAEEGTGGAVPAASPADDALWPKERTVLALSPFVRAGFVILFLLGLMFGVVDTSTVVFAQDFGRATAASAIFAASGIASAVAGFLFGGLRLKAPMYRQLSIVLIVYGTANAFLVFAGTIPLLFIIFTASSLFYAPALILVNSSCERVVPGKRLTEAITWVNTGMIFGLAVGTLLGGLLVDLLGAHSGIIIAGAIGLLVAVVALVLRSLFKRELKAM